MKIGIVSDTHDNIEKAEKAADFFEGRVEKVFHCGDMVAPFTAEVFDRDFEFYSVRGNNDGEWNLKQAVQKFGDFHNNMMEVEVDSLKIAVYHGTEEEIVNGLVEKDYDYVFRGHTHERKLEEKGDTVEVNPGGIKLPGQEEGFSVAVLYTEQQEIEFHLMEE
ncbi:metallophosphoesterase [Candidatus Nanohalovita haloferacivicina]|uniref:metallophosphoesterase n=1 Tax=Candidatus Nanohalovita haloferacivicina TaxID=2978046 RepID=UPI00325FAFA3|nr:Phosphodiesterase [Candidatus Nanohalobia archaeon BNXNv]